MTDQELIARLRTLDTWVETAEIPDLAADRIEELVKEIERRIEPEQVENLIKLAEPIMSELYAVECSYRQEAEAKLAKAVEALRPFAKAAETWEPDDGDSALGARIEHPDHGLERHAEFTFVDLRHARAVLAELEGEE